MNPGALVRALPMIGFAAGAGVAGGAIAYGARRVAGESDGGGAMPLISTATRNPLITGMAGGLVATAIANRIPALKLPAAAGLIGIGAGIAGAWAGGRLAQAGLERRHAEEYAQQSTLIEDTIDATREMYRTAGAREDVLGQVDATYDRSYFNASYHPKLGPFGDHITVGRSAETGHSLGTDDVIAHEYSHRVLHMYAPKLLSPFGGGDARSIHESIADTFAMAVDTDDWLVGEDAVEGGVRSFSHPEIRGSFRNGEAHPAPITREELESGTEEHSGAGVGNKAAWRIGDALGRDTMARIYVAALERGELERGATYADLASAVRAAAVDLYGADSHEARVVDDSWTTAGY